MALGLFLALIVFSNFTGEKNTSAISQNAQTLQVITTDGENIILAIAGNVSVSQITDFFFMNLPDWYNNTNINFNLIDLDGSAAFLNMTVPKNAILGGTEPVVAINGGLSGNNGFTQDNENFYVWFIAQPQRDNNNRCFASVGFMLASKHRAISFSRQTFDVPASVTKTTNVTLDQGETCHGNVHLSESYEKDFNFEVIDPNGDSIVQYENVNSKAWRFIAQKNGIYTLAISNPSGFSTINNVTLECIVSVNVPTNIGLASLRPLFVLGVTIAVGIGLVVFLTIRSKPKASPKVL